MFGVEDAGEAMLGAIVLVGMAFAPLILCIGLAHLIEYLDSRKRR